MVGDDAAVADEIVIVEVAVETVRGDERGAYAEGIAAQDVGVQGIAAHQGARRVETGEAARGVGEDGGVGFAADVDVGEMFVW